MEKRKRDEPDYFGEALSNFTHDVASGGAIRHMTDLGYTVDEICRQLDFPTPRARVQETVFWHLTESGVLLGELPVPEEAFEVRVFGQRDMREVRMRRQQQDMRKFMEELYRQLDRNGEVQSYVSCPYGTIYRDRERRLGQMLSCLTGRERDYILGIPWEMRVMYHRLTPRMLEIATQLELHGEVEQSFYFLGSRVKLRYGR